MRSSWVLFFVVVEIEVVTLCVVLLDSVAGYRKIKLHVSSILIMNF
jgi:hypothetical protein